MNTETKKNLRGREREGGRERERERERERGREEGRETDERKGGGWKWAGLGLRMKLN